MKCPKCKAPMYGTYSESIGGYRECFTCHIELFDDGEPVENIGMIHKKMKEMERRIQELEQILQSKT